jgi:DNA-binding MarR family transcriptional regulator
MAIDTPTTTLKPNVDRLRAEALDLAERCGRSTDAREQFVRLSEQALALWQLARALEQAPRVRP